MKESKRSSTSEEVTEVISRNIIPNHEKDYDDWLERFMRSERQFPGYLGTTIIAPEGNASSSSSSVRYIINRFKDHASLNAWENSEEAIKLLEEVNNYTTLHYERATGLETWFSLPRLKYGSTPPPPPRWKMAIVSFIGAYCISSVVQHMLSIYLGQMPLLINLLMTVILVLGLKYFAMPQVDCLEAGYSPKPMIWARQ